MNVRIFGVCAMECICAHTRPRCILSSKRVLGGIESEPMLTPREKSPLPEDQRRDGPAALHHTGQPAQHTAHWAIEAHITQDSQPNTLPTELLRPTSHRTANPTHYPLSYWGPLHHTGQPAQHTAHWAIEAHITQDSQPNTLPTELLRPTSHRTASPTQCLLQRLFISNRLTR